MLFTIAIAEKKLLSVKYLKNTLLIFLLLYALYLAKSGLGINLSQRYHAWDLLKLPIKVLLSPA